MTKTFAVVGAGPLTGLASARRFGQLGFRVGLIARRRESLDDMVGQLDAEGIEAQGFVGDLSDQASLGAALAQLGDAYGGVDVLLHSPHQMPFDKPSELTVETARGIFEYLVLSAVACVRYVLPHMLAQGDGGILLTTGRSAIQPMRAIGSLSLATPGLRAYAYELHDELRSTGVYIGVATMSVLIDEHHAAKIADVLVDMYQRRDRIEATYGEDTEVIDQISQLTQQAVNDFVWPEVVPQG